MARISPEIEQAIYRFIDVIQKETRILKVFLYGSHAKGLRESGVILILQW